MALVECPECKNQVSDQASSCPKCGHPAIRTEVSNKHVIHNKPSNRLIVISVLGILIGSLLIKYNLPWSHNDAAFSFGDESSVDSANAIKEASLAAKLRDEGKLEQAKIADRRVEDYRRWSKLSLDNIVNPDAVKGRLDSENDKRFWWRTGGIVLVIVGLITGIAPFILRRLNTK